MSLFCKLEDIENESDVEQKLISPLLTSAAPIGLGYENSDIRTKPDLKKLTIGKGSSAKTYYPDYAIVIQGLPVLIIEAKHPSSSIVDAIREARLYATELNSEFPANINPCKKIIVCNGKELIAGFWDTAEEEVNLSLDDFFVGNQKHSLLIDFASKKVLSTYYTNFFKTIRGNSKFAKPLFMMGGNTMRDQEVEQNGFGVNLAWEYRTLFNPITYEERKNVVINAYVTSSRRTKHVEPIEKIIKASSPLSSNNINQINDTKNPTEITSKLENISNLTGQLLLLVGGVGSGKSTFIDYLVEIGLEENLKANTVWLLLDLNAAPVNREDIYNWVCKDLIKKFKEKFSAIDFEALEILKKIYSVELDAIKKGPAKLLKEGSDNYNKFILDELIRLMNDPVETVKAYIRYTCQNHNKSVVIVLDNCDTRTRDDQLLMFNVAKWAQDQFKSLVILPMRNTTYDHHRSQPPLDTVIKDLVFRIEPPTLMEVIRKRVKYALAYINKDPKEMLSYHLNKGMRVTYPRSEQILYLNCIMCTLFQTDTFFRRIISGIAGRDIRKGLEIFLDFCKSGHISSDEILKLRHSQGEYKLPKHKITKVLLRGSKKYYQDANSTIKNLFHSMPEDTIPDPFVRIDILNWLDLKYRVPGPNNVMGYHKISSLISSMMSLGHSLERSESEIIELIKVGCINSESQDINNFDEDDLITISPSGHVHLDLVGNIDYLSACSEDVWYKDNILAENIMKRITDQCGTGHLTGNTTINNAEDLLLYLKEYKESSLSKPEAYLSEESCDKPFDLSHIIESVQNKKPTPNQSLGEKPPMANYPPGTIVDAEVVSIKSFGVFVEFGLLAKGFIHISNLHDRYQDIGAIEVGDIFKARVLRFNDKRNNFVLSVERSINVN